MTNKEIAEELAMRRMLAQMIELSGRPEEFRLEESRAKGLKAIAKGYMDIGDHQKAKELNREAQKIMATRLVAGQLLKAKLS